MIPGIEFSTGYDFDGRELELHMLGYYIDIENEGFKSEAYRNPQRPGSAQRELLAHLNNLGYER